MPRWQDPMQYLDYWALGMGMIPQIGAPLPPGAAQQFQQAMADPQYALRFMRDVDRQGYWLGPGHPSRVGSPFYQGVGAPGAGAPGGPTEPAAPAPVDPLAEMLSRGQQFYGQTMPDFLYRSMVRQFDRSQTPVEPERLARIRGRLQAGGQRAAGDFARQAAPVQFGAQLGAQEAQLEYLDRMRDIQFQQAQLAAQQQRQSQEQLGQYLGAFGGLAAGGGGSRWMPRQPGMRNYWERPPTRGAPRPLSPPLGPSPPPPPGGEQEPGFGPGYGGPIGGFALPWGMGPS